MVYIPGRHRLNEIKCESSQLGGKQTTQIMICERYPIYNYITKDSIFVGLSINSYRSIVESIVNDLSQLALYAHDNTDFGINFKQILFKRAQIASYPWLHEVFLNEFPRIVSTTQQMSLIYSLRKLLNLYDYVNNKERSSAQTIAQ